MSFIVAILNFGRAAGQGMPADNGEPVVGQPCPDVLLTKMEFYKKADVNLHELRGKWVVLDFWDKLCSACIGSFPRISGLQQRFGDTVQFIMVACDDSAHVNRSIFAAYHGKLGLAMPSAFCGSTFTDGLIKQFNVGATPYIVVIDPAGIVKAITRMITEKQMNALVEGESPLFETAIYADRKEKKDAFDYNSKVPFLIYGNGGIDSNFEFRSILSRWDRRSVAYDRNFSGRRLEALGVGLAELYRMAYMGHLFAGEVNRDTAENSRLWPDPLIETTDSALFVPDYANEMNVFDYSLMVPAKKARKEYMLQLMRNDLKGYFGYYAEFETRSMPYFKLVIIDTARASKLRSKGGDGKLKNVLIYQKFGGRNVSMAKCKDWVEYMSGLDAKPEALVDETGITYNIDITIEGLKGNLPSVNECLKRNGLEIVRGTRQMKVLVVRDGRGVPGIH